MYTSSLPPPPFSVCFLLLLLPLFRLTFIQFPLAIFEMSCVLWSTPEQICEKNTALTLSLFL